MQHLPMTYARRVCPNCGADSPNGKAIRSALAAEDRSFESLQKLWYGFFKDKSFFTYARCSSCAMLYSPRYFTDEQLRRLYASMPANMAEVAHQSLERTQRGYFEHLRARCDLRGQFLEIGPDVGVFAQYCIDAGDFQKAWLVEPNMKAHEELRRRLSRVDAQISTSLDDLSIVPDGAVTVAAMIHVLDHLTDPAGFLRRLMPKLAPNAAVLIVTHNERSLLARALGPRWPAYCLQHPHLFNPASIRAMLTNAGFSAVQTTRSTNHFPVGFLAKQALLAAGIDAGDRLPPVANVEVPLKLGNIITVANV